VIRCACLLVKRHQKVLLARVRNNELWYLPGGTIEVNETPEDALVREVLEELGVAIDRTTIALERQITGPAYGRDGLVELNCFTALWSGQMAPNAEVSELAWFGADDKHLVAPAIQMLFDELWPSHAALEHS
jgi:8-oxo-dGTP pyrophosphatase MutT (NUDIX family)